MEDFLQGPGVIIDGGRQNDQADAKAAACRIADQYISKRKGDAAMPPFALVEWTPPESHAFCGVAGSRTRHCQRCGCVEFESDHMKHTLVANCHIPR